MFKLKILTTGFLATSIFNFFSISILLYVSLKASLNPTKSTFFAHSIGLILSMIFTLDVYWGRISKEIVLPVKIVQRIKFLGIGGSTALLSLFSVETISNFQSLSVLGVLMINWTVIGLVAILKYLSLTQFVQDTRSSIS